MSKRHYSAIFVLLAILIGCSTDVSTEPCIENARYITVDCQAKIAELQHQQAKQQQQLENQARRAELGNWLLAALVVVLCSGALVAIRAVNQRLNSNAGLQVWQEEKARQHQQAMAKIYGVNAASLAASSRPLPVQMPHTLTMNNTDSHAVTYTDGRRYNTRQPRQQLEQPTVALEPAQNQGTLALPSVDEVMAIPEYVVGFTQHGERVTAHQRLITGGVGISGNMGSGKSSVMLWQAAQMCLKFGAELIIVDKHKGVGDEGECLADRAEPLRPFFACEPIGADDMGAGLDYILELLHRRLTPRRQGKRPNYKHIFFMFDEVIGLVTGEHGAKVQEIGLILTTETRKVHSSGAWGAHMWFRELVSKMGYVIPAHVMCQTSLDIARVQTGIPKARLPEQLTTLTPGQFYWKDAMTLEPKRVRIPHVTAESLSRVVEARKPSVRPIRSTEASRKASGSIEEVPVEVLKLPIPKAKTWTAEEQRVIDALEQGMKPSQIVRKIFGITGGRKYAPTRDWVNEVWRRYSS